MTNTPLLPSSVNSEKKKRIPPKGKPYPPGVSGNPAGAPPRGQSWGDVINKIGNMTPHEAGKYLLSVKKRLKKLIDEEAMDKLTMKEIVVLQAYSTLSMEANASLMNALMDRGEGKIPNTIALPNGQGGSTEGVTWAQLMQGVLQEVRNVAEQDGAVEKENVDVDSNVIDGEVS